MSKEIKITAAITHGIKELAETSLEGFEHKLEHSALQPLCIGSIAAYHIPILPRYVNFWLRSNDHLETIFNRKSSMYVTIHPRFCSIRSFQSDHYLCAIIFTYLGRMGIAYKHFAMAQIYTLLKIDI